MASAAELVFNVVARDGASPAFKTVAAEVKSLQAAMAEADAKMSASSRAATAEIDSSLKTMSAAHRATVDGVIRGDTEMTGSTRTMSQAMAESMARVAEAQKAMGEVTVRTDEEMKASTTKLAESMSVSMREIVAAQRQAEASTIQMGATVDKVAVEEAAATKKSAVERRASMMNYGLAAAGAVALIGYESVKAATSFEASMARVQTMAGASAGELKRMSDGILNLAPKVGVGPDKLAESLYHIESAGFSGAKALDMVAASAKLSAIGQDDINSSTQAVVATLASNIKGVRDANDAAAQILHTVGTGDMTMHQFTQALGTGLLATASAVGLSFRDVGAAIATMTDNAIPADQAATKLRTSLLMMVNPSGPAIAALNSIGLNAQALAADLQKPDGLKTALDDIRTHLDNAFPKDAGIPLTIGAQKAALDDYRQSLATAGVQGKELDKAVATYADRLKTGTSNTVLQEQAFAKMFGGSKNAGTMLVLFNEQLDRMNPKLDSYGDANSRAAEMQAAWAKQQDTFKQKLNDLGATFDVMKIKIGNALLPVLKDVVGFLGSHIGLVETLAAVIGGALVAATVAWAAALLATGVGEFVAAVGAAVFVIYELTTNLDGVVKFLHGPWGTAIAAATAVLIPFVGIPMLIWLKWKDLVGMFASVWHDISSGKWWEQVGSDILNFFGSLPGKIIGLFKDAKTWLIDPGTKAAGGFIKGAGDGILDFFKRLPGDITNWTTGAVKWLWDLGHKVVDGLKNGISDAMNAGFDFGKAIGKWIGDEIPKLPGQLGRLGDAIGKWLTEDFPKKLSDFLTKTDWGHVAKTIVDGIVGGVSWMMKNKENVMKIAAAIIGLFGLVLLAIPATLLLIGASIVWGIVDGIYHELKKQAPKVVGFFVQLWVSITQSVSDLKDWIIQKFSDLWHGVTDWMKRIVADVIGKFFDLKQGAIDKVNELKDWIVGKFGDLRDNVVGIFDDLVTKIGRVWDKVKEIVAVPIRWVIDNPYDKGIVPLIHGIGDILQDKGMQGLKELHFARGGVIPGNHDQDTVPFYGTPGEVVVPKRIVNKFGGPDSLMGALGFNGQGGGAGSHLANGGPLGFIGDVAHAVTHNPVTDAVGGALGAAGNAIGGLLGGLKDLALGALGAVAGPAIHGIEGLADSTLGGMGQPGKWMGQLVHVVGDKLLDLINGKDAAYAATTMGGQPISWNGGANTIGLIERLALEMPFGNIMQITSTSRPWEHGSYHAINEAVDFSNGTADTPQMEAFNHAWAAKYGSSLAELIHAGGVNIKDGRDVGDGMGFYGAGTMSAHHNHVHVAISPASIARGGHAFQPFANAGGPAGEGSIVNQVHQAAIARGWGGQLGSLDYIINHESSYRPDVGNPGSTAYGLFQLLYGGHGSVAQQIQAGFSYIAGRYGDPDNAQRFWASHHWYANGGMPPIGQPFIVGENGPETMVLGAGGATVMPNGQSHRMANSGNSGLHFHGPTYFNENVDLELKLAQARFVEETVGAF